MAFELPTLPVPADVNGVPHLSVPDGSGYRTVPISHSVKKGQLWVLVSSDDPLPFVLAKRLEFLTPDHDAIDVARMSKGPISIQPVFDAVTTGGTSQEIFCGGFNALLLHHVISGGTTGGYATIKMSPKSLGTFIDHHGKGQNIKNAATTTSYISLFEAIFDYIKVVLTVTDGTHTVIVQPINL